MKTLVLLILIFLTMKCMGHPLAGNTLGNTLVVADNSCHQVQGLARINASILSQLQFNQHYMASILNSNDLREVK